MAIIDNSFQFKGKLDTSTRYIIHTKFNGNDDEYKFLFLWLDNGIVTLNGDYNDFEYASVTGLPIHEIANTLSALKEKNSRTINVLSRQYNTDDANNRRVSEQMEKVRRISDSITIQFIKEQPNNLVSLSNIAYLTDKMTKEELQVIYNALDQELKETNDGISLKQYLTIEKVIEKGDQIVNLKGKSLNGEEIDLETIIQKNTYTVLDFWAANCGPCRMQSKQYKKLYETYKEKDLEIVSFSLDVKKEEWEKASQEDSISWVNISDLKGFKGIIPMTYGIRGIPNSFLINKKGEVIKEFIGFIPDKAPFQKEIEEYLGNQSE